MKYWWLLREESGGTVPALWFCSETLNGELELPSSPKRLEQLIGGFRGAQRLRAAALPPPPSAAGMY